MADIPHEIEIVIQPGGQMNATVHGIEGPACSDVSQWLDDLGQVTEDRPTADFDKESNVTVRRTRPSSRQQARH